MIPQLPQWMNIVFVLLCAYTLIMFFFSNGKAAKLTLVLVGWCILHSILALKGFYLNTSAVPPRFIFVLLPTTLAIIFGVLPKQREWLFERRGLHISTWIHIVRIPVEIILFYLFTYQLIPELMTFEGRNFDILAGITAPIIALLFFKKVLSPKGLLIWNIFGLGLILFILFNGILSSELPFQQFAFDQPNRAMMYFPYVLLPGIIVPIVIYTHITDIIVLRKLIVEKSKSVKAIS